MTLVNFATHKEGTSMFLLETIPMIDISRPGSDAQQKNRTSWVNASQARRHEWPSMIIFAHTQSSKMELKTE